MVCRTTDEYRAMAQAGCLAVGEPAFWAGYDRSSADGFRDYFVQLTECEPARAAKFGMTITRGCASTLRRRRTWPLPGK